MLWYTKRQMNCCWILGVISLINGLFLVVISSIMLNQAVFLYIQEKLESKTTFAKIYKAPFKNSNWMKSAIPLTIVTCAGIFIGILQTVTSLISLLMDCSKIQQIRKLGWFVWMGSGICVFSLSCLTFGFAITLKAHEYRHPEDKADFFTVYQQRAVVIYNIEGHLFCSALAFNCSSLLGSMALIAGTIFRQHRESPHAVLAI